mgnify:CR=1 FL=1
MKGLDSTFACDIPHSDDMIRAACEKCFIVFAYRHGSIALSFIYALKNNIIVRGFGKGGSGFVLPFSCGWLLEVWYRTALFENLVRRTPWFCCFG